MTVVMVCFLFCDIAAAGNLALPADSMAYVITSSLTGLFYTPALVCIAASADLVCGSGESGEVRPGYSSLKLEHYWRAASQRLKKRALVIPYM